MGEPEALRKRAENNSGPDPGDLHDISRYRQMGD
jgi:hypothetical protein